MLLNESDVINVVCAYLEERGYSIRQALKPTEKGVDIIGVRKRSFTEVLHVEAKGETSSRVTSARYGLPFNSAQTRIHVAEALYKAITVLPGRGRGIKVRSAIALIRGP